MDSIISGIISNIIAVPVIFILSILLENQFGIFKLIKRKWHYLKNSEVYIKTNIVYNTTIPLVEFCESLKNSFRLQYNQLKIYKESPTGELDMMINNMFHIRVYGNPNNEVSIQTNKISFKMQGIQEGLRKILDTINIAKEEADTNKQNGQIITEKEFSLYLELPYSDPFVKIYTPKEIQIKNYEVRLSHLDHKSEIVLNAKYLNLNAQHRYDLENLIKYFI